MPKYYGTVKNRLVKSDSIKDLKRKASIIANGYFDVVDELLIGVQNGNEPIKVICTYRRVNRKCPNNTIERGVWK